MDEQLTRLRMVSRELGAALFGVTSILGLKEKFDLPTRLTEDLTRGISIGVRLSDRVLHEIETGPTKLYFHHYRQVNFLLDRIALHVASLIQDEGFQSLPIPASQVIDWENQRGHLSHKLLAFKAGLGWIGRNNLLVNPDHGARIRLVSVLTDMNLPSGSPLDRDCGRCDACVEVCPAGAIHRSRDQFDHRKCYEKLKEFRASGLVGQYICGVCVKACRGERGSAIASAP